MERSREKERSKEKEKGAFFLTKEGRFRVTKKENKSAKTINTQDSSKTSSINLTINRKEPFSVG